MDSNSVFFVKLHLNNYGQFLGQNELVFDRHRTLIIGDNGTGKTIIVNVLAALGPAPGIKPNNHAERPEMSVEVVTRGNRELIKRYRHLIFLGCEASLLVNQEATFSDILNEHQQKRVAEEARSIFQAMLAKKPCNIKISNDLIPEIMSAGERICLGYAYVFAIRKVLNLNLPAVFDSPYGKFDLPLRNGVRAFLKEQSCQQILLGCELEFTEEAEPPYWLESTVYGSKVRETTCFGYIGKKGY